MKKASQPLDEVREAGQPSILQSAAGSTKYTKRVYQPDARFQPTDSEEQRPCDIQAVKIHERFHPAGFISPLRNPSAAQSNASNLPYRPAATKSRWAAVGSFMAPDAIAAFDGV